MTLIMEGAADSQTETSPFRRCRSGMPSQLGAPNRLIVQMSRDAALRICARDFADLLGLCGRILLGLNRPAVRLDEALEPICPDVDPEEVAESRRRVLGQTIVRIQGELTRMADVAALHEEAQSLTILTAAKSGQE